MEPERPEGNGDGRGTQEGLQRGGAAGVVARARAQGLALKERAEAEAKTYKDPQQTQLWKSIFRVSHDRSDPRNRSLAILSNVFLHLHPAKINRDAKIGRAHV